MDTCLDTGALVPLYVSEVFSEAITAYMERRGKAIPLSAFHRLELENALRLKVFRGEMTDAHCVETLKKIDAHIRSGMLVLRPVNWIAALDSARQVSKASTVKTGCRTLDLIHVAIAAQWGCSEFVSADDRQLKAAKRHGLKSVDLRRLDRGKPRGPGKVKERRAPYRTKKSTQRG